MCDVNRPATLHDEMTPPGGCPDAGELAAFIDGRLAGAERARVVEHLAACERCYAVFSAVGDFQEEEREGDAAAGPPLSFTGRRSRFPAAAAWAAAAGLILALGAAWLVASRWSSGRVSSHQLIAALDAAPAALAGDLWQGPVYRSPLAPELELAQRDFLLGVHLVDLRIALAAGDAEAAERVLAQIDNVIGGDFFFFDEGSGFYGQAREQIEQGRPPAELLAGAAAQERDLDELLGVELALGKWTEAARLAAASGDAPYLEGRRGGRLLSRLLAPEEDPLLDPRVLEELRSVETLLASDAPAADLGELAERLDRTIRTQAR